MEGGIMTARILQIPLYAMLFIFLAACGQNQGNDSKMALLKTTNPDPVQIKNGDSSQVEKIKHDISSFPEVYDVAVIKGKKDILAAYKVKHMYRFQMKTIEKNMKDMLEKKYPKEQFTVSSDYKIFLEAVKLQEAMKKQHLTDKKAEKRLQKIIDLQGETT